MFLFLSHCVQTSPFFVYFIKKGIVPLQHSKINPLAIILIYIYWIMEDGHIGIP